MIQGNRALFHKIVLQVDEMLIIMI